MAAPLVKTRHPGIYKRGKSYVVRYRANGVHRSESCATLEKALQVKRSREAARDSGELDQAAEGRVPLRVWAEEWINRYQGSGKRGFTENTREEYRRDLKRYVYPFLGDRRIGSITPRDISNWIAWLCDGEEQGRIRAAEEGVRPYQSSGAASPVRVDLADATVRRILSPMRACLSTARREGVVRSNACDGVPLPNRPQIVEAEEEKAKAMTREQLAMFLRIVPRHWSTFFRTLAATGLRWSEIAALRWRDLELDGSPCLQVRRAYVKGKFKVPKSRYGVRKIPLAGDLALELRERRSTSTFAGDDDLVFPATNGKPLRQNNVRRRVLQVTAQEAGVAWPGFGFHAFRHTCASMLFEAGRNVKQVQRWLGHHSPGFTLDTYVHLLDDGVGAGLDLAAELPEGGNEVGTSPLLPSQTQPDSIPAETVS
jgi:integrase